MFNFIFKIFKNPFFSFTFLSLIFHIVLLFFSSLVPVNLIKFLLFCFIIIDFILTVIGDYNYFKNKKEDL